MRIRGKDLRQIILEELSRSMRYRMNESVVQGVNLIKQAAAELEMRTITAGGVDIELIDQTDIGQYMRDCKSISEILPKMILSSEALSSSTGAVLGHFSNIIKYGSESEYSKSIKATLANLDSSDIGDDGKIRAIIASLQTGEVYSGAPSDNSLGAAVDFDNELKLGVGATTHIKALNDAIGGKYNQANFLQIISSIIGFDIISRVDSMRRKAAVRGAKVTVDDAGVEITDAPASAKSGWDKYVMNTSGGKGQAVRDAWNKMVRSGSAASQMTNDGEAWTSSFGDFKKYYRELSAERAGKAIDVETVLASLDADSR